MLRSSVVVVAVIVGLVVSLASTAAVPAQTETTTDRAEVDLDAPPVAVEDRSLTVAGALLDAVESVSVAQDRLSEAAGPISVDGRFALSVLPASGAVDRVAVQIEALGGVVEARLGGMLQVLLDPGLVETVGSLPGVLWVELQPRPTLHATAGEGIEFIRANAFHDAGITGDGVHIGILDTGFAGISSAQASGDAPPDERWIKAYWGCDDLYTQSHGRQVVEVVYDIAPGATLHWACIDTIGKWEPAVDKLIEAGVDIIVASLGYEARHRGDGTGDIHDVVEAATAAGILWVNSAGNEANKHWGGDFVSSDGDTYHEFSVGVETVSVNVPDGQPLWVGLRWDDWPTTAIDLNLYLWDPDIGWGIGKFLDTGEDPQTGTQPPKERVYWRNDTGEEQEVWVTVTHNEATVPSVDLDVFTSWELDCPGCDAARLGPGSLSAPADAVNAFTVGAVCDDTAEILPYSSQGPTKDGRLKPSMTAPSTVATTIRPTSVGCTGGFNGTSAAAPHVAGAAALIKELHPTYAWHQLRDRLLTNYEDPHADGDDNVFGRGILRLATEAPVAVTDYETVDEDGAVSVYVLDNDSDVDHSTIWVTGVEDPIYGAVAWGSHGKVTYYHDGSEEAEDWFSYEVTDGVFTSTGWIHITVLPINDPPWWPDDNDMWTTGVSSSSISVAWTAAEDDIGVAAYAVYLDGRLVTTTTNRSYTFTGLQPGTQYHLSVLAGDADGEWTIGSGPSVYAATASTTTNRFIDDDDSVFEADIEWMANQGITKGCNPPVNDRFCPDTVVTRGQMAAFLVRALGLTDRLNNPFVDDDDSIFEADIERLAAAGITRGCNPPTNDRFCPDGKVTREQMAAFLVRALKYTDDGGGDLFTDDDDSVFEGDIDRMGTAGVTKGCNPPTNDRYCPKGNVTRGQMAAFLHRALD